MSPTSSTRLADSRRPVLENAARGAIVAVLVVLAACSGGSGSATPSTTTSTTAARSTTTAARASSAVDLKALPLGDGHVTRDKAGVGNLDLCSTFPTGGGGAQVAGPWISGTTFDITAKIAVQGDVAWPSAAFTTRVDGASRVLTGNDLPVNHHTGSFPIAASDPAAAYDRNPSAIAASQYELRIPAKPAAAATVGCVGGEVGVLLSGVVLNSPVDAMGRDAVAHELQDRCSGHPNQMGYHYHSVPTCLDGDTARHQLVGYALDGYGIFGRHAADGTVITDADLDECHGHTHEIAWDGATVTMYHYHASNEFPYVVGCFHGTNSQRGPFLTRR